jgi:hypothetical protein
MRTPTNNTVAAVTKVVSDALETPMEELPPLSHAVDLDALDELVSSNASPRLSGVTVTFTYAGLNVVVLSCGTIYATPITHGDEISIRDRHS